MAGIRDMRKALGEDRANAVADALIAQYGGTRDQMIEALEYVDLVIQANAEKLGLTYQEMGELMGGTVVQVGLMDTLERIQARDREFDEVVAEAMALLD